MPLEAAGTSSYQALETGAPEAVESSSVPSCASAWYELVPAVSRGIHLPVAQGDVVAATVSVVGNRVTLRLSNRTRHRSFAKTLRARQLDISSADWIVESPSACPPNGTCHPLPLADFGVVRLTAARAQSASGTRGTISSRHWHHTSILLSGAGQELAGARVRRGSARPSVLEVAGSAFEVVYTPVRTGSAMGAFVKRLRPRGPARQSEPARASRSASHPDRDA